MCSATLFILVASCNNGNVDAYREEIIKADKEFSDYSVEHGMKAAFLAYADERVIMLRDNHYPAVGKNRLDSLFGSLDDSSFTLSWEPMDAISSRSGDLGFSYGTYSMSLKGDSTVERGTYVSVWARQESGAWKYVLDSGNTGLGETED